MQKNKNTKLTNWSLVLKLIFFPIIISAITIFIYYPSLTYPFQFDDKPNILKFFEIRNSTFESLMFTRARWISMWLNTVIYKFGKFDPFLYRSVNLTFHVITGILLFYFIFLALFGLKQNNFFKKNALIIASINSILFLLHPIQTQTISYIVQGQLEGLASLFVVAIVLCFLILTKSKNFFVKFLLTILLITLTIFSTGTKEIAIVAPFLVVLTDWFFIAQGDFSSFKKRMLIHLLLFIISFSFYFVYLKPKFFASLFGFSLFARNNIGNIITKSPLDVITPWSFFISQFKVILHYLYIFIWPFNISVEYDWKLADSFFSFDVFIPFIILLCIGLGIIYLFRKNKTSLVVFGLLWFFITIAPRSSFIPSSELLADYKTYLASLGLLFLLSSAITKAYQSIQKLIIEKLSTNPNSYNNLYPKVCYLTLFIFLTSSLGISTYQRNKVWSTSLDFWKNIIDNAPKARAFNNYGIELANMKRFKESIPFFKKAIKLEETCYADPYTNLANVYAILGNIEGAVETLQHSLKINPNQPEAYNNLGSFFLHLNDFANAQDCFEKALKLVPHYGKAMVNFGRLHVAKNEPEEALFYFNKACSQSDLDNDSMGYEYYAKTCMNLKKYNEAIIGFKKALELCKNEKIHNESLFNLANSYFLNGQYNEAIKTFNEMTKKYPEDPRGWRNLIETYVEIGKFQEGLDIIDSIQLNGNSYSGMEIQKAKLLGNLGYMHLAYETLNDFIKKANDNDLLIIAKEMLSEIKYSLGF